MEYEFADCSTDPLVILMMREGDEDTGEMESRYTAGSHRAQRYEGDRYEGDCGQGAGCQGTGEDRRCEDRTGQDRDRQGGDEVPGRQGSRREGPGQQGPGEDDGCEVLHADHRREDRGQAGQVAFPSRTPGGR